jgi:peptidoglycan/xylan/chitin deacetylase (PgdA/CDA1 family)
LVLWIATTRPARAQTDVPVAGAVVPEIAFTFDDLPAHGPLAPGEARPAVVRSILTTLKAENMPPIYGLVNGFRMVKWPYQIELLREWLAAGNSLGSHTWSHPHLDLLSTKHYEENIARNEPTLRLVDPHGDWHWFRYPYLEEGNTVEKREKVRAWLFAHDYRIAEVSIDFQDWAWDDTYGRCSASHDEAGIARLHTTYLDAAARSTTAFRALSHTLYGRDIPYILLMHVGAYDAIVLPDLIAQYRGEGFRFITLPEAAADPVYAFDPKVPTPGGATFLEQVAAARKVNVPDIPDYSAELNRMCRASLPAHAHASHRLS